VVPSAYPIPNDGPVGELLVAQGRHPYRPAHVHFRIDAKGYEELITHVFISGDKYLDSDVVFGTKPSLIRAPEYLAAGVAPDGRAVTEPWALLSYDFVLLALG
jgi:hydroxyquinol 1,2-dioxygenase